MKRFLLALMVATVAAAGPAAGAPREFSVEAADGVRVFADVHLGEAGKKAPTVLLFHQAGANGRAEYSVHVPRLLEAGYNVVVTDQRSGGAHFGGHNRTADALGGGQIPYCDAYPDLEAVLAQVVADGFTGPLFAWGSSYSAALVVRLGVDHGGDLAGVLAFSPASSARMEGCRPDALFDALEIPALIVRPGTEAATETVQRQLETAREAGLQVYVAKNGVHGSSMLDAGRVGSDVEAHWKVVLAFLAAHAD